MTNLLVYTSGQLYKNMDHKENIRGIVWENIKFSSNLYEIQIERKKVKCLCYNLRTKKCQIPLGDTGPHKGYTPPLKFQKSSAIPPKNIPIQNSKIRGGGSYPGYGT